MHPVCQQGETDVIGLIDKNIGSRETGMHYRLRTRQIACRGVTTLQDPTQTAAIAVKGNAGPHFHLRPKK